MKSHLRSVVSDRRGIGIGTLATGGADAMMVTLLSNFVVSD